MPKEGVFARGGLVMAGDAIKVLKREKGVYFVKTG